MAEGPRGVATSLIGRRLRLTLPAVALEPGQALGLDRPHLEELVAEPTPVMSNSLLDGQRYVRPKELDKVLGGVPIPSAANGSVTAIDGAT